MPDSPAGQAVPCVYCRKHPAVPEWRPFCSERCKLLDLAKWIDGGYAVPGAVGDEPTEPEDE